MRFVALLLAATACTAAPGEPTSGVVAGVITDRATGAPIPGVRVFVPGETATITGADGRYALPVLPGAEAIQIDAPGYFTVRRAALDVTTNTQIDADLRLDPVAPDEATQIAMLAPRPPLDRGEDQGDLRPEARAIIDAGHPLLPPGAIALGAPPATIRVWRRAIDGSTASCSGRVDVIPFEQYVKGVLPHEWIASWDDNALQMGAVAIRTYAWYWVASGGKYSCADIDDTTASQVYQDATLPKTDADVDATTGVAIVNGGSLVFAEYSAENGDPTADGVAEPYCAGHAVNGHGHGTCQWGTQRWASNEGKDYVWMTAHYYPGATAGGGGPDFAASRTNESYPQTMTAGDEVVAWVELTNDGNVTWDITNTRLGTTEMRDRASAFWKDGNWISPGRPTAVDHGTAHGATGRFTFVLKAPEVSQPTQFVEHFGLVQEGTAWFGPEDTKVTWTITVNPRSGSGSGGDGYGLTPYGGGGDHAADPGGASAFGCEVAQPARRARHTGGMTHIGALLVLAVAIGRRGGRFSLRRRDR